MKGYEIITNSTYPFITVLFLLSLPLMVTGCTGDIKEAKGDVIEETEEERQARKKKKERNFSRASLFEEQLKEELGPCLPLPPLEQENPAVRLGDYT